MKFNPKHFKFETKSRRFKLSVWQKYFSLKKKKKLTDFDKFWMRQLRAQLKINQFKLIGVHLPTKTETEWTVKKDLSKEKLNRKEYLNKLLLKIQEKRKYIKLQAKISKTFEGARYTLIGNVFETGGTIKTLGPHLTTNNPMAPKKPRRKDKNYIGIELEFNQLADISQAAIADKLKIAGLARYVDVTSDSSCGWEVRVLLLEDEFQPILIQILDVLNSMGFLTNDQCGTHVHFDMRNRNVKVVYENLFKTQKFLRKFITRSRKYNRFCKMNKADTFDKQLSLSDRYYSLNVEAYNRHRTLEIRMHQGTLQANELIPWINFLLKIMNYTNTVDKTVNTLKQAKKQFDIDDKLGQNLEDRILSVFARPKVAAPNVATTSNNGLLRNWF